MSKARQLADLGNAYDDGALSNRRINHNGAMQVAQRGTSETGVTTSGYYTCDRWNFALSGAGTWTVSQSSNAPEGFANSMRFECTTANASLAAGALAYVRTTLEGQNLQHLKKGTANAESVTVQVRVRSNKTGTYHCTLQDQDNNRLRGASLTISAADTWETKVLTFEGDTTGAFDNDENASLQLHVWFAAGSNYTGGGGSGAWAATANGNYADTLNVNLADTIGNYFELTGVQLEVGDTATPFEHRSFGQELLLCQRYYQVVETLSVGNQSFGAFTNWNNTSSYGGYSYVQKMRASPTASTSGGLGTFYNAFGATSAVSAVYLQNMGVDLLEFNISHGSLSQACSWWRLTTNFKLMLDAEL